MDIIINDAPQYTKLHTVPVGSIVTWREACKSFYMVIPQVNSGVVDYNLVDMASGKLFFGGKDALVTVVKATLHIN